MEIISLKEDLGEEIDFILRKIKNNELISKVEREKLRQKFDEYKKKGQIEFITFHQSYAYEEFVEGLKPNLESEDIKYKIEDGVFKKIAQKANFLDTIPQNLNKINFWKMSLGSVGKKESKIVQNFCFENGIVCLGFGEKNKKYFGKSKEEIKEEIRQSFSGKIKDLDLDYSASQINYLKNELKKGDILFITTNDIEHIGAIAVVENDYGIINIDFKTYPKIMEEYAQYRKVRFLAIDLNIPVKDIYNKNFTQGTLYKLDYFSVNLKKVKDVFRDNSKNYILIIDEINRSNISKIFGELITLIEENKRLGEDEEITITLPYSKETFGVPKNLYIIGTMNTADRSIALLDTALRRRFEFVEMISDSSKLKDKMVEGINLEKLLEKLNRRIEYLYDRDHTIGHVYFMDIDNLGKLKGVFKNKIIPLLSEYFYEDFEKIRLVLADNQVEKDFQFICEEADDLNRLFGKSIDEVEDKKLYKVNEELFKNDENFIKACIKIYDIGENENSSDN